MTDCCSAASATRPATTATHCPACGRPGRPVERITLKALLGPDALMRLTAIEHRFCPTAECEVVYFGVDEAFRRDDVTVPVFQKEPPGERMVCYCFAVSEGDIAREVVEDGATTAERIRDLVQQGRCACEVRNPQGTCCLGNVALAKRALVASPREIAQDA